MTYVHWCETGFLLCHLWADAPIGPLCRWLHSVDMEIWQRPTKQLRMHRTKIAQGNTEAARRTAKNSGRYFPSTALDICISFWKWYSWEAYHKFWVQKRSTKSLSWYTNFNSIPLKSSSRTHERWRREMTRGRSERAREELWDWALLND